MMRLKRVLKEGFVFWGYAFAIGHGAASLAASRSHRQSPSVAREGRRRARTLDSRTAILHTAPLTPRVDSAPSNGGQAPTRALDQRVGGRVA